MGEATLEYVDVEYRGNLAVVYLNGNPKYRPGYEHVLKGLAGYIKEVVKENTKHVVLDLKDIKRIAATDLGEIMEACEMLKDTEARLHLGNLRKNEQPYVVINIAGIIDVLGIGIIESLDEKVIAELSQQNT